MQYDSIYPDSLSLSLCICALTDAHARCHTLIPHFLPSLTVFCTHCHANREREKGFRLFARWKMSFYLLAITYIWSHTRPSRTATRSHWKCGRFLVYLRAIFSKHTHTLCIQSLSLSADLSLNTASLCEWCSPSLSQDGSSDIFKKKKESKFPSFTPNDIKLQ